jgi:hypothetical protein
MAYADGYVPIDKARFDEMLTDARRVTEPAHLAQCVLLWIADARYPRRDISTVLGIVEREKGWR